MTWKKNDIHRRNKSQELFKIYLMAYHAVLSRQRNLMSSSQIIFKGRQNLKRVLKKLGLCTNRDIQFTGSCLPFIAGSDVVDDGVLVEVGGTVVLLVVVLD